MIRNISLVRVELWTLIREIEKGCEVLITKCGLFIAKLVPFRDPAKPRVRGSMEGEIWIAPDFGVLPGEIRDAFGRKSRKAERLIRRQRTLAGVLAEDAPVGAASIR